MARQLDISSASTRFAGREIAVDTPRALGLAAVTAVLVAALGTHLFVSNYYGKVVPGVRVDGVPIGGLPPDSASTALVGRAKTVDETRLQLRAGDQTWQPTMAELGVGVDPGRLADRAYAIGRDGSPLQRSFTIGSALFRPIDLVAPSVDPDRLSSWVDDAATRFDRPAADATLAIDPSGAVQVRPEQIGRRLDRARAVETLNGTIDEWLRGPSGTPPPALELTFATIPPSVTAATIAPARAQAEGALARPVTLKLDADSWKLQPADLARMLAVRRDGTALQLDVDGPALSALVDRIAGQADRKPKDASLAITPDAKVAYSADEAGRELDRAAAREQIRAALLSPSPSGELQLPAARIPARVRADDLAEARRGLDRALAGPTKLVAGEEEITLQPKDVAPMLRVSTGNGPSKVEVDDAKLKPAIEKIAKEVERAAKNPRLKIVGGAGSRPNFLIGAIPKGGPDATLEVIEPGKTGQHLDVGKALDTARSSLLTATDRTIKLPLEVTQPFDAANRAAFGSLEFIEGSTTSYAGSIPERRNNVELATKRLDGVVIPPHTTFSFNEALGSTSFENGYLSAWGFASGPNGARVVPSVGGGICQIATTLFQAVFWAGYQIEDRSWHLFPMPRYSVPPRGMPGLDATVDEAADVDLKWTNNTDHPVVIQARVDGSNVSFALFGQKPGWQVKVDPAIVSGVVKTSGRTVTQYEPSLPAGKTVYIEEALDGYTATVRRTVTAPGQEPRVLTLVSTYQPSENIIAVGTGGRR